MQGNKITAELSQAIITHIVGYVKGLLGAIYITGDDGRSLRLTASTAIGKQDQQIVVPFGEGIVGQAAVEKRSVIVTDIAQTDFKLSSSFGSIPPKNVIAVLLYSKIR